MEGSANRDPMAGIAVPGNARSEVKAFESNTEELCFALLSFAAAFCYSKTLLSFNPDARPYFFIALVLMLTLTVEYLNRRVRPSSESILLLLCFLALSAAFAANDLAARTPLFPFPYEYDRIWSPAQVFLFVHIFFVWYAVSRSGKLLEGKTGHLLPMDALNAAVVIPFGSFFLRIRTLIWGLKLLFGTKKDGDERQFPWMNAVAVAVSLGLLVSVTSLLMDADENFGRVFTDLREFLRFDADEFLCMEIALSIPVGAWLWGLMGGSLRYPAERLEAGKNEVLSILEALKKVSARVWTWIIAAFSAVYLIFFAIQGNYLFSAFFGKLPEGFIVSEYARRGFFELCKVTALNFLLTWMATRTADKKTRDSKLFKGSCLLLLSENMLFAAVAISKLWLYISIFGITPPRIQSSWFAAVLFLGCVMWICSILTQKSVFRYWVYFGAVSLCILAVI